MEQREEGSEAVDTNSDLKKAMLPFVLASGRVPADAKDSEKVYLNGLTAGDFRKAREAYGSI